MASSAAPSPYPLQLLADFNNGVLRNPAHANAAHATQSTPSTHQPNVLRHATPAFNPTPEAAAANTNTINNATPSGSMTKDPWLESRIAKTRAAKIPLPPGMAPAPGKSPLEPWRSLIEERTKAGESCEQIAAALQAQGVSTSDKSVSRYRIAWGFRRRAQRKQSKPPKPASERKKTYNSAETDKRRAAITHMTQQGMSAEEIAQIMAKRGMVLSKGVSTIFRLQSRWGLRQMPPKDRRSVARAKARRQQEQEFKAYAKELGVAEPDRDKWVREKMASETALTARHEIIKGLMGDEWTEPTTGKYAKKDGTPQTGESTGKKTAVGGASIFATPGATPATASRKTRAKTSATGKGKAVEDPMDVDMDTDAEVEAQLAEESSRVLRPRVHDRDPRESDDSDFDSDGASEYGAMAMNDHSDGGDMTMDPGAPSPWPASPGPAPTTASIQRGIASGQITIASVTQKPGQKHTSATFSLAAAAPAPRKMSPILPADSFVQAAAKLRDISDAYVSAAVNGVPGTPSRAKDMNEARAAMKTAMHTMMTRFPDLR